MISHRPRVHLKISTYFSKCLNQRVHHFLQFHHNQREFLVNYKNQYEYGIGGGIVWDSDENDEWNEAQHKSKILSSLIK